MSNDAKRELLIRQSRHVHYKRQIFSSLILSQDKEGGTAVTNGHLYSRRQGNHVTRQCYLSQE